MRIYVVLKWHGKPPVVKIPRIAQLGHLCFTNRIGNISDDGVGSWLVLCYEADGDGVKTVRVHWRKIVSTFSVPFNLSLLTESLVPWCSMMRYVGLHPKELVVIPLSRPLERKRTDRSIYLWGIMISWRPNMWAQDTDLQLSFRRAAYEKGVMNILANSRRALPNAKSAD